jgi:hypothetical protein
VKALSKPMWVVLHFALKHPAHRVERGYYPAGQERLILQGLLNRQLIDEDEAGLLLTAAGVELAELAEQEPLAEVVCPNCEATIRARMADAPDQARS